MVYEKIRAAAPSPGSSKPIAPSMLRKLSAPLRSELDGICKHAAFQQGETVLNTGMQPDYVGCVNRGILRMQKTLHDGRRQIVGLMVEGDMFGRVFEAPMDYAIEAATEASICMFKRSQFEELMNQSLELERFVLMNILNELDRARDWMVILSNHKVSGRLAGFLVVLCTRFVGIDHVLRVGSGSLEVNVPINRVDLAHLLGTRVESISRAFAALAKADIIRIHTPYLIEVLDIRRLVEEAGDEDMASVHVMEQLIRQHS